METKDAIMQLRMMIARYAHDRKYDDEFEALRTAEYILRHFDQKLEWEEPCVMCKLWPDEFYEGANFMVNSSVLSHYDEKSGLDETTITFCPWCGRNLKRMEGMDGPRTDSH